MLSKLRRTLTANGTFSISVFISLMIFGVFLFKEEYGWDFGLFDQIELQTLDIKFLNRGIRPPGKEVAIAAIDERSIERFGRWPWNRMVIAQLIQKLTIAGARVIAFDIGFVDKDRTNIPQVLSVVADEVDALEVPDCTGCEPMREAVLSFLKHEIKESDPDKILAETISQAGNVVLGYFIFTDRKEIKELDQKRLSSGLDGILSSKISLIKPWDPEEEKSYKLRLNRGFAVRVPLPVLLESTESFGHFTFQQDRDGAIRWGDLIWEVDSGDPDLRYFFPSLSLVAAAKYLDREIVLHTYPKGVDRITLGLGEDARDIQTNFRGRLLINFHGPEATFPTHSVVDILDEKTDPKDFKDKIILVGATATAAYDLRTTPFQEDIPGVEIHANIIDNILHDDHITRPDWAFYFELFVILFFGILFGVVLGRVPAIWGALFIIFVTVSYLMIDKRFFFGQGYWVKTVLPLSEAFLIFLVCYIYRYVTEEKEKKRTRSAFKQYLNESVIDHVMNDFERLELGGEKREITVLFSDIRGFTSLSETLSPEDLGNMLTEYLNPMTQLVFENDGVLDKYMGDAIMAFWGAPTPQQDHAVSACRTALQMMHKLELINNLWTERGIPHLKIGIGINTGPMWVGNMGSSVRFDYTIIGDAVNLGSRLEGTNKQYGTAIIISEYTRELVKDLFLCRELDCIRVKGKLQPVRIYELLAEGVGSPEQIKLTELFSIALEHYRQQRWDEALRAFHDLLIDFPKDEPSRIFAARCKQYELSPPPQDWDKVFTMTRK